MIHFPFDEKKSLERFKSKSEFLVKSQSLYSEFSHFTNFFFDFRDAQDNSDRGNRERSRYSPDHAKTNSETTNPNFLFFFVFNRGDTVSQRSPIEGVRPSPYTTLCS